MERTTMAARLIVWFIGPPSLMLLPILHRLITLCALIAARIGRQRHLAVIGLERIEQLLCFLTRHLARFGARVSRFLSVALCLRIARLRLAVLLLFIRLL